MGITISDFGIAIPKSEIAISHLGIVIPKTEIAIPKSEIAIPKSEIAIPKCEIAIPKCEIAIPGCEIAIPKTEIAIPGSKFLSNRSMFGPVHNNDPETMRNDRRSNARLMIFDTKRDKTCRSMKRPGRNAGIAAGKRRVSGVTTLHFS
ncbi:MAG: hypothetical protein JSS81_02470 [Acidobacteria bacterium]|nr:hypothetical protein [Acidobacteriota bacterium]